jgi:hypothetical protein
MKIVHTMSLVKKLIQPGNFFISLRTVKSEDETLESDTKEQTYIISGAADDSDEE